MESVRSGAEDFFEWIWHHLVVPVLTAEPITVLTLGVVLGIRMVERRLGWFSMQPVRSARRRAERDPTLSDGARVALPQTTRLLTGWLRQNLATAASLDVAAIAHEICVTDADADPHFRRRPFDTVRFAALASVCDHALEPGVPNLIVRYLVRGSWDEHRELIVRLVRYLDKFDNLRPVSSRPLVDGTTFAEGVSVLSGALVLADFATGSARAAERVAVWHTGQWQGRQSKNTTAPTPYLRALRDRSALPQVGNYNGRVPTLIGAEVRQSPGSDGATLLLVTGESDYFGTEPDPSGNDHAAPQCKKLIPQNEDHALRRFVRLPPVAGAGPEKRRLPIGGTLGAADGPARNAQLNVKIGLVSFFDGHPHLVLMRRTGWVSNARGTIAPTAGGVVELPVPGDPRDSDGLGSVDFLAAGRREMAEELGLRADQYSLGVHAVFLSNNRPRPVGSGARSDLETGELVATVLGIGTTRLAPDDFEAARIWASPGTGLYESHGVVFVPMGSSATEFADNVKRGRVDRAGRWVGPGGAESNSTRLYDAIEQPTLLAALYAGAHVFGPGRTVAAFRDAAEGTPWWAEPWPEGPAGGVARICRDPRSLIASDDGEGFEGWASTLGFADWPRLLATLRADAEHWSEVFSEVRATGPAARA